VAETNLWVECLPREEVNEIIIKLLFSFKEYSNKLISDVRGSAMNSQIFILGMETRISVFTGVHNGSMAHPVS
jgi:uncharacterized protein (DUF1919 family)